MNTIEEDIALAKKFAAQSRWNAPIGGWAYACCRLEKEIKLLEAELKKRCHKALEMDEKRDLE